MIPHPKTVRLRWLGLGVLLLQLGWFVAMPPFAAMDEWDHAYRASAVAHGQWVAPPTEATRGTGAFVLAPSDIVRAARTECERIHYGGRDECVGTPVGQFSRVASGAGRYSPVFYALVGWPSNFLEGQVALYAMRLVGLVLCWVLFVATFASLRRWAGPLVSFAACLGVTPAVVYASAVVAPNGLEIVSGFAFWAALASIAHSRHDRALDGWDVVLALTSCSLLLSLRSLGPLWAALIVVLSLMAWRGLWNRVLSFARTRTGVASGAWLILVALWSLYWTRSQGALEVGRSEEGTLDLGERALIALRQTLVWTFEFMGAFPYRNNPAPPLMYACLIAVFTAVGVFAIRASSKRERWALAMCVGASYAIPYGITIATVERFGTAWQGRYALPLLLGVAILCGVVLDRRVERPRAWLLYAAAILIGLSHAVAVANTLRLEHDLFIRSSSPPWPLEVHPVVVGLLALAGTTAALLPFVITALSGGNFHESDVRARDRRLLQH